MNLTRVWIVSPLRNRDDGVMALLFGNPAAGSNGELKLSMSSATARTAVPPLVLLHPLGSTGAMSWAPLTESLRSAGHRVATPDLPGHGSRRDTPFTWENARATIRAATEQFAPEKPVLIGHSLGAATAIYAAQRDPDRFSGLVLSGAGTCWNDRSIKYMFPVAVAVGAVAAAVGRRELLAHAAGVRGRQILSAARSVDVAPIQLWCAARQLMKFDIRETPPPPIPCGVIVLTDDRRMPPGLQRALARYLGCAQIDVAADHDAPVRETARFYDGVQAALAVLGGDDEIHPVLRQPVVLIGRNRRGIPR
jgi:pimeloyl-ACP methyl ester carboxylesterase